MSNHAPSIGGYDEDTLLTNAALAILAVIAAFVVGLLLALIGGGLLLLAGYSQNSIPVRVAQTVLQFVGFIAAMLVFLQLQDDWGLVGIGLPDLRDLVVTVGGFLLLFGLLVVVSLLIQALGLESATNAVIEAGQGNPEWFLYMIPITILLVGPGEELVFRGVVQGLFRRSLGPVAAVAEARLLFGAVHVVALIGNSGSILVTIAVIAVLGAVLGGVYEYTDNLVVPAVIHGLFNAFQFAGQYAVASGLLPEEGTQAAVAAVLVL